jgi:PadR family transcriptional regulator PadR
MSGIPELLVLRLLAKQEMYGYELARDIRLVTQQAIAIGESVLYPALHSLEQRRLLCSRRRKVEGRVRVYYRITPAGMRRLLELGNDWKRIVGGMESALKESGHG